MSAPVSQAKWKDVEDIEETEDLLLPFVQEGSIRMALKEARIDRICVTISYSYLLT